MENKAISNFKKEKLQKNLINFQRFASLRYLGQDHSVEVLLPNAKYGKKELDRILASFHDQYEKEFTYRLDNPVELIQFHLVAIAKIELKRIPIFGWSMIAGGHFFVDRKNKIKALKSLSIAKKSMAKNPRSIIIYPEGTRSKDGEIGLFKKGGFVLAMEMNLPVVPIALCGTFESFGKNKMTLNKNNLELRIGKPFQTSSLSYEDRNGFVNSVRNEVIQLKSKTR